jgi:DNA-directed RNA polymerase subunit F
LQKAMLTIKEAKKLLKKESSKYTDEQLNGVVEWLNRLAIIEVEQIKKSKR